MRGKPRPRRPERAWRLGLVLAALLLTLPAPPAAARELRRQMPFLRPLLMGDAYVAVGDEASTLLYNPAGLARLAEGSVEAFSFQFSADRTLTRLLLDPDDVQAEYGGLDVDGLEDIIGTSLYFDVSLRLPFVVSVGGGSAFGLGVEALGSVEIVEDPFGLPALDLEYFLDQTVLWSTFTRLGGLSLGLTVKAINRIGIDKVVDAQTLFLQGGLDLENDPDFAALAEGETRTRLGSDFGLIYELPGFPNWQPRLGLAVQNLGGHDSTRGGHGYYGIEFGPRRGEDLPPLYGRLPLNVSVGFALSPVFNSVRYTFAVDVVDLLETALPGDSLTNRTRVGMEVGVGPHEDGTAMFSLLFGWNATHFGVGVLSRVWIFEIGFGRYTVEKGERPGVNPDDRRVLLIAIRI